MFLHRLRKHTITCSGSKWLCKIDFSKFSLLIRNLSACYFGVVHRLHVFFSCITLLYTYKYEESGNKGNLPYILDSAAKFFMEYSFLCCSGIFEFLNAHCCFHKVIPDFNHTLFLYRSQIVNWIVQSYMHLTIHLSIHLRTSLLIKNNSTVCSHKGTG